MAARKTAKRGRRKYGDGSAARAALAEKRSLEAARAEVDVIQKMLRILDPLKPASRANVLRFLSGHFGVE